MKFIKLTSALDKKTVFINPTTIGHMYEGEARSYGPVDKKPPHTVVGTTCHNNGGFKVTESIDEIMKMIKELE